MMNPSALLLHVFVTATASSGSSPVAAQPELVGPGTLSTTDDEVGIAFTHDGEFVFITRRSPTTNTTPVSVVFVARKTASEWSTPEVAAFSGWSNDFGVTVSSDDKRVLFSSDRKTPDGRERGENYDIWEVPFDHGEFGEPKTLGAPVDTQADEAYPSLAADGALFFASNRDGGAGGTDIYRSAYVDGHYETPINLRTLNSKASESQPAIAPDQLTIVFSVVGTPDVQLGKGAVYPHPELFVSYFQKNAWSTPVRLPAPINSTSASAAPMFSSDQQWLYFVSDRSFVSLPQQPALTAKTFAAGVNGIANGWNNVYRVPVEVFRSP